MPARGFAKRPRRQSDRTGGGEAVGVHASHTVAGGSIVAPQDGQIVAALATADDFVFFAALAVRSNACTSCVAALDRAAV